MRTAIRCLWRKQQGIVSLEAALIFPVLLFILVMFFELARIALVITIVNTSLERAVQNLRSEDDFYSLGEAQLNSLIVERVASYSYDLVDKTNLELELNTFATLGDFSGTTDSSGSRDANDDDDTPTYANAPILNITLTLNQDFITPLPQLFDLGSSYQHEFQQILGDLVIDGDEDEGSS